MSIDELIEQQLGQQIQELGLQLEMSLDEARNFLSERMAVLATFVGTPEFTAATVSERDTAAIGLGITLVNNADEADLRFWGFLQGLLAAGAQSLATNGGAA